MYVEIAVNSGVPQRQTFSYAMPDGVTLAEGDAVLVPFGRRQLQGIVMHVVEVPAFADPKPVDGRLGDAPVVSKERIRLAQWLSEYYLAPLFASVALMLPPGFEQKALTFYQALAGADELDRLRLPPRQRAVLDYLVTNGSEEARQVEANVKEKALSGTLSQLVQRGLVQRTYGLDRPTVRAKTARYVALRPPRAEVEAAIFELERLHHVRRARVLRLLLEEARMISTTELSERTGAALGDLRPLIEDNLVEVRVEVVERDPLAGRAYPVRPAPQLTAEQELAYAPISSALDSHRSASFLLHGVTGSGKTEVYLQALEHAVAIGRRGIVLVPEIALTPQTVRRFAERFPGKVAVLHSGLSQGELFDQWHGIAAGRYAVVVGSRSAVFAPQPDLGLIVIDEEHEWTYKQHDLTPRYHARDAALELGRLCDAVVVMGSATPDMVSYQKALWGQHLLLELRQRVRPVREAEQVMARNEGTAPPLASPLPSGGEGKVSAFHEAASFPSRVVSSADMPPVDVVDMREELKGGNRSIFSRALQLALFQTVERGEQAILFLNRRGAASFLQCRDCGFVPQCSSCAIALGFHRQGGIEQLRCHQCNRNRRPFERCPMCGGGRLRPMGLGVEAVEEGAAELLPGLRTLRWDRDVTQGKNAHEQILARFLEREADVLIGTQMVAKGLDLPSVTLVGVISADIGLHIPDFRSAERTFQLLTQVAGRAGRTASSSGVAQLGRVVIQTYTPDNYAIVAAAQHDYHAFFEQEVELRREEAYPPFVRLARLVYSHSDAERGQREAARVAAALKQDIAVRGLPGAEVMGPATPHVPKWHGRTRWQLTVRAPDPADLLRELKLTEGWTLDIDPASLA